jgi:hypothetical protein
MEDAMTAITIAIQLPNPFQAEDIHRDVLRAVRATGATATPVSDGRKGSSFIEIVPQVLDLASNGVTIVAMFEAIKSIADCLRVYKEAQLTVAQHEHTVTLTPAMTDDEREALLHDLILDTSTVTATVNPATPAE